jgi:ethanolamine ammonia-lyase small subunit
VSENDRLVPVPPPRDEDLSPVIERLRALTPARVLSGRVGTSYRTEIQLALREDHAAAVDAVHAEIDFVRDLGAEFVTRWRLQEMRTRARTKHEYLMRPDLGRQLDDAALATLGTYPRDADIQLAIGDGLSATAVAAQVPELLPLLAVGTERLGLRLGRPFFIRNCRVGVLNDIGRVLSPKVAVLLIGERPGLATAESLSAYLAYRPHAGHTDANRNLISNIHARGTPPHEAAERVLRLAQEMMQLETSGVEVKEPWHGLEGRAGVALDSS